MGLSGSSRSELSEPGTCSMAMQSPMRGAALHPPPGLCAHIPRYSQSRLAVLEEGCGAGLLVELPGQRQRQQRQPHLQMAARWARVRHAQPGGRGSGMLSLVGAGQACFGSRHASS